jgi:hypothetical protein
MTWLSPSMDGLTDEFQTITLTEMEEYCSLVSLRTLRCCNHKMIHGNSLILNVMV